VLCLLIGALAAPAAAQQDTGRPADRRAREGVQGVQGDMGMMGMMDDASFAPTLPALQLLLTLSQNQLRRVVPLRDSMLAETRETRGEAAQVSTAIKAARDAGVGSDSLAVLRDRMEGLEQKLMPARLRFQEALKPMLTREQRGTLDAHRDALLHQVGQRMRQPA
jgi:hypothetical protein